MTCKYRELLEAAAKPYARLWHESGELNLNAVAAHYATKGYSLSQPSLLRLFNGKQLPGNKAVEATFQVFGVPRALLRGEPLSDQMKHVLTDYRLSTLMLADRIEKLSKNDYHRISDLIELLETKDAQLKRALEESPNVLPLARQKRDR